MDKQIGRDIILLDGAMGTMLQKSGLPAGVSTCVFNFTNPDIIRGIHKSYVDAGADIIVSNTLEANRRKLTHIDLDVSKTVAAAVSIAKEAAAGRALTALDLGPVGEIIGPAGEISFDECVDIFKEVVLAGVKAGADLILIETVFDLYELKAAVIAAKENCDLPILASMTFQENSRTFAGAPASAMAVMLDGMGVAALGVNCSLGPAQLTETVKELAKYTSLPILAKPNAGLPDLETGNFNIPPEQFAAECLELYSQGACLLGGCCGTTPGHIKALSRALSGKTPVGRRNAPISAVCSGTKTVVIDNVRVIGERLNPTGKKAFREALLKNDMNYILKQGLSQVKAGADILDVNVGAPGIDEERVMANVITSLQSVTDAPLVIDSSNTDCIGAALRVYNGKPIVNSVNGEMKSMQRILPMVKKYGAAVIALCLDENGIPPTARGRFDIARRILDNALAIGIKKEDIFIDCLTLTVSAQPDGAVVTLETVEMITKKLGLKTVLGVSNISFGLPNREALNRVFLSLAIGRGLNLPIINPQAQGVTETAAACKALLSYDTNCEGFIKGFSGAADKPVSEVKTVKPDANLTDAVLNGLTDDAAQIADIMLNDTEPMDVINNYLIPALDIAGDNFDAGSTFLPQLLKTAEAAKAAFSVINKAMAKTGGRVLKGKILLATVKGDIHDIGKNIVRAVLENYGYEIIDLGKNVAPEAVVAAVTGQDIKLAGLSALMTTTLDSMQETIAMVKKARPDCKIIVGGAVLTDSYAKKIGADYYAKDAKAAVDIARLVYS